MSDLKISTENSQSEDLIQKTESNDKTSQGSEPSPAQSPTNLRQASTQHNYDIENEEVEIEPINVQRKTGVKDLSFLGRLFSPIHEGSLRVATFNAVGSTFGCGCLVFPYAISLVGLVPGIIIFLLVSFSTVYTVNLVVSAAFNTKIYNFGLLTKKILGNGWFMTYNIFSLLYYSGVIMMYQYMSYIFIGTIVGFENEIESESEEKDRLKEYLVWLIIPFCVLQILVVTFLKVSYFKWVSIFATSMLVIVSLIVLVFSIVSNEAEGIKPFIFQEDQIFQTILKYVGTFVIFMFGYQNHSAVLLVMNNLSDKTESRVNKVIWSSFTIELIFYAIFAFSGYLCNPNGTLQIFVSKKIYSKVVLYIIEGILAITFQALIILRWALMKDCYSTFFENNEVNFWINFAIITVSFIIMNAIVYFVKKIISIIMFFGGAFGVMLCFFIPLFLFKAVFGNKRKRSIFGFGLFIFFGAIGIGGTISSIFEQLKNDKKLNYKY